MAEERLIDTDKDKKYRFRINEDGEEELYIAEDVIEEEEKQLEEYVPDYAYDDETTEMSPEQVEVMKQKREEERARVEKEVARLRETALREMEGRNFTTAMQSADVATEYDGTASDLYALKLRAVLHNLEEGYDIEEATEVANAVKPFLAEADKVALREWGDGFATQKIEQLSEQIEPLEKEVEEKKASRRAVFQATRKKTGIRFGIAGGVFLTLLAVAITFFSLMIATALPVYMILGIVFGALALAVSVVFVLFARHFADACDKCRRNENNRYTKIGRELMAMQTELEGWQTIQSVWTL